MEHIYKMCFYGGLVCAIFMFILAFILFIKFNIPKVFGDLSGNNEKKSIKGMNNATGKTSMAQKGEQEKYYRGHSEKIKARKSKTDETETSLMLPDTINGKSGRAMSKFESEGQTGVLTSGDSEGQTGVLASGDSEGQTGVLVSGDSEGQTGVLTSGDSEGQTGVLTSDGSKVTYAESGYAGATPNNEYEETSILYDGGIDEETTVLSRVTNVFDMAEAETAVLTSYEEAVTEVPPADATSVLASEEAETGILTAGGIVSTRVYGKEENPDEDRKLHEEQVIEPRANKLEGKTKIYFDAVVVHTNERL